jgi:hypothetical protein
MLDLRSRFFKRIDELSETNATHLVSGSCGDYAEYKMMVGKLAGLQQARQEFQEIWDKLVQQTEED